MRLRSQAKAEQLAPSSHPGRPGASPSWGAVTVGNLLARCCDCPEHSLVFRRVTMPNAPKCRDNFFRPDMSCRDRTAWLRWEANQPDKTVFAVAAHSTNSPRCVPEPVRYVARGRIPGTPNSSEVISQTTSSTNRYGASSMNSVRSQYSF